MGFWTAVMFFASVAIQQVQADKMRAEQQRRQAEAEAAADAAKGIPLVIDGEASMLPIIYGRALVGGARCYSNTFNAYKYDKHASDIEFKSGTAMLADQAGVGRHEYLITQQSLCFGPISAVYEVLIDGRKIDGEYYNELTGEKVYSAGVGIKFEDPFKDVVVVHVHNGGNIASSLLSTRNDTNRKTALFTDTTYATCAFRYNRDDPKYSGVPTTQFYIEGRPVASIAKVGDVYNIGQDGYSNNPALCLLDYLRNKTFGLGLDLLEIDLKAFYDAYVICEMTELANIEKQGYLWLAKGKTPGVTRDVKRFECNLAIDTSKPVRDNINSILSTMFDASLIWSSGQYKLVLDYPEIYGSVKHRYIGSLVQHFDGTHYTLLQANLNSSYEQPAIADGVYWNDAVDAYISDADIVREGDTTLVWPNAQSRLNYATVRFLNEINEFKEDTVSWPSKTDTTANTRPFGKAGLDLMTLYHAYLYEDSNIALETEEFAKGVVTKNLAQARAEQIVRASRNQITYEFSVNRNFINLEPGDIISLSSQVMGIIVPELVQLTSVVPDAKGVIKLSGKRFDAATFAWNANDNEASIKHYIYGTSIVAPGIPSFSVVPGMFGVSSGRITWASSSDHRVTSYDVMLTSSVTPDNLSIWSKIGSVRQSTGVLYLDLPILNTSIYTVAIVACINGAAAAKNTWTTTTFTADANKYYYVHLEQFIRSNTAVTTVPTDASYDFIARTFTPSTGWVKKATGTGAPLYFVEADVNDTPDTALNHIASSISWSTPALVSMNDKYTHTAIVYTTSSNASTPIGGSFDFTLPITDSSITVPTSTGATVWTAGVPNVVSTGFAIYASQAVAESYTNTGTCTNTLIWSKPVLAIAARALDRVTINLCQWSTIVPTTTPAVTGDYTWNGGAWSNVVGAAGNNTIGWTTSAPGNKWYSVLPSNPGTPGMKLIQCALSITAFVGDASTSFDFANGVISVPSQNGFTGAKSVTAALYAWGIISPAAYTGTVDYTWLDHSTNVNDTNIAWKTTIDRATTAAGNTAGKTLWQQFKAITETVGTAATTIDWATASILPIAYQFVDYTSFYIELSSSVIVKDSTALDIPGNIANVTVSLLQKTGSSVPTALQGAYWTIVDNNGSDLNVLATSNSATNISATATAPYYTIRMYKEVGKVTLLDTQTIAVVLKSQPSIVASLSNDGCIITTAPDGTGGTFGAATSTTMEVRVGANLYTNLTYSNTASPGVLPATGTAATFVVASMSSDTGYVDMIADSILTGPITKRFSLAKSKQGSIGTSAKYVDISTTAGQVFTRVDSTAAFSSTPITLTVTATGDTASFSWTRDGVTIGVATAAGLTTSTLDVYSNAPGVYKVTATFPSGATATDEITILQLTGGKDGKAALSGNLTNQSINVSCDADGLNVDLSKANGDFDVYSGDTKLTSGVTYAVVAGSVLVASFSGSTYTISGIGTWAATTASASITFRATVTASGATIDKVLTLVKAYKGTNGSSATTVTAYAVSSNVTAVAIAGAHLKTGSNLGLPNAGEGFSGGGTEVWSKTPADAGTLTAGQYQYMVIGSDNGTLIFWETPFWASLKVGNLSALSANTGALAVSERLTVGAGGLISSGKTFTEINDTAAGFCIGGSDSTLFFGDSTSYLHWGNATGFQMKNAGIYMGAYTKARGFASPGPFDGGGVHLSPLGLMIGNPSTGSFFKVTDVGDISSPSFNTTAGVATYSGKLNVVGPGTAHMEITDNVIKVFDASGVCRVKIGNLI